MLNRLWQWAAVLTLSLLSSTLSAAAPLEGQAANQGQTNASSSSNTSDQKKTATSKRDADKLAKEDKLSKERYSTRGLHPPDKTSGDKAQGGDSSQQNSQPAAKPDAKDPK